MSVIETGDGSLQAEANAAEDAKIAQAKEELVDERVGGGDSELILGKYGSQDELIQAYQSLQSEYSKLKGERPQVEEEPEEEPERPQSQPEPTAGVTPEKAQQIQEAIFRQTGGEAKYQALAGWAAKSLDDSQISAFNSALESGDMSAVLSAVKGLQYDYMMATGFEPRLSGGRAPSAESKGFESEAQVVAAMNDPRYRNGPQQDPAYVREVEAKLRHSNVFSAR